MATQTPQRRRRTSRNWKLSMPKHPGLDYLMLRIAIFVLVGIGVVMAFSATMTWSVIEGNTVWAQAFRQTLYVVLGLVAFWLALRTPFSTVKRLTPWFLAFAGILTMLVFVPGIGVGRNEVGSQSWIVLGPIRLQPSEIARIAVAMFGALSLANKRPPRTLSEVRLNNPFVIYILISMVFFGAMIAEGNLGVAMTFAVVVGFTLFFAGINWRVIALAVTGAFVGLIFVFLGGGYRGERFTTFFGAFTGNFTDTRGSAFQSYQGFLSLADGSLTGVGIGQSRAKWFYLPEAKNDFVFAIIGEELGLFGGVLVILMFVILGIFGLRTAMRAQNQFQSLLAATLTATVASQAFYNISYVIGLMPMTGVQLPLISSGGTSTVVTLGAMGLLASVARHEPEAVSYMQSYGRPLFDRVLMIPEPTVAVASARAAAGGQRSRERSGRRQPARRPQQTRPEQRRADQRFGTAVTSRSRTSSSVSARSAHNHSHSHPNQKGQPGTWRQRPIRH
ncbi:putative peptidoglycan glycosyltransferase FtsW [Corynebacterium propinquum]|uniref:FtsW/RodA/SpoVE family cell cycle protein n=1 Tax=Corynebacterium propinquum TaxID=43769 RepID=UPI0021C407CF|nr:putative peptidoglycan glycosyltransferase FtsW [Corynebacterium propinquum]MDK4238292.1 putative peptidoglycan glycosyltransferase FtsW [Corynebacterium propinquum]